MDGTPPRRGQAGAGSPGTRQPRSAGTALVRRLFSLCAESERSAWPVDELAAMEADRRRSEADTSTRREFIARGASVAAATAVAGAHPAAIARAIASRPSPRIAIVGAGLAGLRCAHAL